MSTINLYTRREDFTRHEGLQPVKPKPKISRGKPAIPAFDIYLYKLRGLSVYGFKYQIEDPNANFVLASMTIPAYFEEARVVNRKKVDTHGLFLIDMGENPDDLKEFFEDVKIFGSYGCPKRVITSADDKYKNASQEYFTFNRMRFYPFILPDFTVGYYACDDCGMGKNPQPRNAWPRYRRVEYGVALDAPVTFDPTLGIYLTRAAHIEPIQNRP